MKPNVSLPYGFTLFSNYAVHLDTPGIVSLPYGFTLFSNWFNCNPDSPQFHYLMDLHYSQTSRSHCSCYPPFHYLMDLHYSQTSSVSYFQIYRFTTLWIYTILKRIESNILNNHCFTTLWIYTILKPFCGSSGSAIVSLPYGFTLFSNPTGIDYIRSYVSLPYGFTLFSNNDALWVDDSVGFTTLWIYTILKQ